MHNQARYGYDFMRELAAVRFAANVVYRGVTLYFTRKRVVVKANRFYVIS